MSLESGPRQQEREKAERQVQRQSPRRMKPRLDGVYRSAAKNSMIEAMAPGPGDKRDRQRKHRDVVLMLPGCCACCAATCSARSSRRSLRFSNSMSTAMRNSSKPPAMRKASMVTPRLLQQPRAAERERQQDAGGDGDRLPRHVRRQSVRHARGHGREHRRHRHRIDGDEKRDEGGKQQRKHQRALTDSLIVYADNVRAITTNIKTSPANLAPAFGCGHERRC